MIMHISTNSRSLRSLPVSLVLGLVLGLFLSPSAAAGEHRIGLGIHYWKTVNSLTDDFFDGIEDDGRAFILSYQYVPQGLFRFGLDLEVNDDGFGGSRGSAFSPIGWILVGKGLYGGVGVGFTFADDFSGSMSDPFFAARIGFEFTVLPRLTLDINANYRADAFSELEGADTDAITLAAIGRFSL